MPRPNAMGRPKPKIEDPMGKLKRLFCYIFKNYGPHCVFVLVCIIISVLANVQGTMFTQSLIDDYIVPLTKTAHPNFGPLAAKILQVAGFYGIGVITTYAYNRIMVNVTQGTLRNLRVEMFGKMETLPMLPKHMKLTVLKKTAKQYNEVKKLMNRSDVSEIVIATDAGREGELVARWIIEKVAVNKPLKRLWISSQTDKAILDGFKNLRPGRDYDNLYKAAVCRAEADWLVGLNVTRALTCKHNAQLSAGRVQSPTLAMIVNREEEIRSFKPKTYYTLGANANGYKLSWVNKDNNSRIFDEEFAKKIESKLRSAEGKIVNIAEANKKKYAPALYDLTELQRDANKIWGYSAKQTLSIMQRLYENYKILTYPRTDSRYITTDIVATIPDRLKAIAIGEYRATADTLDRKSVV